MKTVLLIGLGRFGRHLAMQLNELGHQVMAVDRDEERVNECMPFVTNAQKVHTGAVADLRVGDKGHTLVDALLVFVHCHHLMAQLVELHGKMPPEAAQSDQ